MAPLQELGSVCASFDIYAVEALPEPA